MGRVNRLTGRREGGLLGLTSVQSGHVSSAHDQLTSRDPSKLGDYLGRVRRDKRFDHLVKKAIKTGKPIPGDGVDRMVARYSDRLLALRAETVARNETLSALHASQSEAIQQLIDDGKLQPDQITKIWGATGDLRTRDTHRSMDKQSAKWGRPFVSPSGAMMQHPHDLSLGAPLEETIQCRCFMQVNIDFLRR